VPFLDEDSIRIHKEYVENLGLRYSILEKSIEEIKGKKVRELLKMRLSERDRQDVLDLLPEIVLHKLYFSSFSEKEQETSVNVRSQYGSEAAFLNALYKEGINLRDGFLVIYKNRGKIEYAASSDYKVLFVKAEPIIALDLCEHAYFLDYGFRKKDYLFNSLSHLRLSLLDK